MRQIFEWKQQGYATVAIAQMLRDAKVLTPYAYKKEGGFAFYTPFYQGGENCAWSSPMVRRILLNETYTGLLQQGKEGNISYKVKQKHRRPREEWICCENTHQPIIEKETFLRVQKIMKQDTRVALGQSQRYWLSGFLYCGECQRPMIRRHCERMRNEKIVAYDYYVCPNHKTKKERCGMNAFIREDTIYELLSKRYMRLGIPYEVENREFLEQCKTRIDVYAKDRLTLYLEYPCG